MTDRLLLARLSLSGFRAYLHPKAFDLSKKRCLAVFAPNGCGKSSMIDALEFMLHKDGTLERLGQRAVNTKAGPIALVHTGASQAQIVPEVTIGVYAGNGLVEGTRPAADTKRLMPDIAAKLNHRFVVSPIIRGHALRAFVEAETPEQRYADVARWLELGPLVEVQKNIRALRTQLKAATEDDAEHKRIDRRVASETKQEVKVWQAGAVIAYVNTSVVAPLDKDLTFTRLALDDANFVEIAARAEDESSQIGLSGLRQISTALAAVYAQGKDGPETQEAGDGSATGAIVAFETAVADLATAQAKEASERDKAANSAFQTLWEAAEPIFAEEATPPETCPVCTTPLASTSAGSANAIADHIRLNLEQLGDYAAAKRELETCKSAVIRLHTRLTTDLRTLIGLLAEDEASLKAEAQTYLTSVTNFAEGVVPSSGEAVTAIKAYAECLAEKIDAIETRQGDHTYTKAKALIEALIQLNMEYEHASRIRAEVAKLYDALTAQAVQISSAMRKKLQVLLDQIQSPMNAIYRQIQGAAAPMIRLELPPEDDVNQQRLNLLIDFAENRSGVQPTGYLSDSQIHSMALALRLAAITRFNTGAPIIALDDIVTSYDADHRRSIVGLIATLLRDWQILLTTHDERFFNFIKDQLEPKTWHYTRIIGLDPAYGPRFADHKVSDEMIAARWAAGEQAANEMRQAEEEWLLGICRDFGVQVRIRPLERAYSYERSELASALAGFLAGAKLTPQAIVGVNNRFLDSLVKGEIENFGSHFQDAPYGDGSLGDERVRWEEFKSFRDQFVCGKCTRRRFQRPHALKKPVCAHAGCEAQFEFKPSPAAG